MHRKVTLFNIVPTSAPAYNIIERHTLQLYIYYYYYLVFTSIILPYQVGIRRVTKEGGHWGFCFRRYLI